MDFRAGQQSHLISAIPGGVVIRILILTTILISIAGCKSSSLYEEEVKRHCNSLEGHFAAELAFDKIRKLPLRPYAYAVNYRLCANVREGDHDANLEKFEQLAIKIDGLRETDRHADVDELMQTLFKMLKELEEHPYQ